MHGAGREQQENRPDAGSLHAEGAGEEQAQPETLEDAVELARQRVESGMSVSSAAKEAAELTGFKKGDIYKGLIKDSQE